MENTAELLITFFVPCLNEEGNVGPTIDNIVQVGRELEYSFEIIVVDDASTDGTVAEVRQQRDRYPDVAIALIENEFCRGLGRNYFMASHKAQGEYYMLINGDAVEPVPSIRKLLTHVGEADAIIPYFGLNESRTWSRRQLSRVFTFCVNSLSGNRLQYYNGPVIHRTENVVMWFSETVGFGYQAELLCRLLDEGISTVEVQIENSDRERGASKAFTLSNLLSTANTLFHILLRRLEGEVFPVLAPPGAKLKKTRRAK